LAFEIAKENGPPKGLTKGRPKPVEQKLKSLIIMEAPIVLKSNPPFGNLSEPNEIQPLKMVKKILGILRPN